MHTHIRAHVHTLVLTPLVEIEFSLRDLNSLSDETPSKSGLPMCPNKRKQSEKEIEKQKCENERISELAQSESRSQFEEPFKA